MQAIATEETRHDAGFASDGGRRGGWESTDGLMLGLRRHRVLERDEETKLAEEYRRTGDLRIAHRLVEGHLRLVIRIARECCFQPSILPDLIQEGSLGLMKAVQKYDPDRGVRLSTYASWWIRAHILQYILANSRIMRVATTLAQRKLFFALRRERERMERAGEDCGPAKLAERLGVSESDVIEMTQRLASRDAHLDSLIEAGEVADDVSSELDPDAQVELAELRTEIRRRVTALDGTLDARERLICEERLCADEPMTLQELGSKLGVSRERARQIETRLKHRLQEQLSPLLES